MAKYLKLGSGKVGIHRLHQTVGCQHPAFPTQKQKILEVHFGYFIRVARQPRCQHHFCSRKDAGRL